MPDGDLFEADGPHAAANAEEFARGEAERETSPVTMPGLPDRREEMVRQKLGSPPFMLGTPTIDDWLERHSPTHILACLEKYDRIAADKAIGRPIPYLEAILTDSKASGGRRHGAGRGATSERGRDTADRDKRWQQVRAECQGQRTVHRVVVEPGQEPSEFDVADDAEYAEGVMRALGLAAKIAANPDHPNRDAWEREYMNLP